MDICIGIMDKYARFYVTVWIDVTVESSSGDTSADKLTVILEVKYKEWLASFKSSDLTDSVVHIFSLLRCQKQICCCFISDRHIMEIPCIANTFVDQHIQEFIAGNGLVVL